jgi:hypothetical protein
MMKKNALLLFTVLLCSLLFIGGVQVMEGLTGTWNYQVEQTAPEYSKGTIVFEQEEDERYSGKIVFQSGQEISMSSVALEADTVTFKAYVDGGLVTTICTLDENELTGTVRTPDGMLPFSATREE